DLQPGPQQIKAELASKDALPFNNTRFATFAIRTPRKILIIADDPRYATAWKSAVESQKSALFGCDVLNPDETAQLGPAALARYQAISLFGVQQPAKDLWVGLKAYVQNGGGLAVAPGGIDMARAAYESLEALELLPGKYLDVKTRGAKDGKD